MGRIKSTLIKRTAKELVQQIEFTENFDQIKKKLKHTMPSKKVRNKVAGYIARLKSRNTQQIK